MAACAISRVRRALRACDPPASRTTNRSPPAFPQCLADRAAAVHAAGEGSPRMPHDGGGRHPPPRQGVHHEGFARPTRPPPLISARCRRPRVALGAQHGLDERSTRRRHAGESLLAPVQSRPARAVAEAAPVRRRAGPTAAPWRSTRRRPAAPPPGRARVGARAPPSERRRGPFPRAASARTTLSLAACPARSLGLLVPPATSFAHCLPHLLPFRSQPGAVSPVLKWSACIMAL